MVHGRGRGVRRRHRLVGGDNFFKKRNTSSGGFSLNGSFPGLGIREKRTRMAME